MLPITVERLYDGDLLLALGGRVHEYWKEPFRVRVVFFTKM